jgi:hypothetical protein
LYRHVLLMVGRLPLMEQPSICTLTNQRNSKRGI